jgi:hypothetical protein
VQEGGVARCGVDKRGVGWCVVGCSGLVWCGMVRWYHSMALCSVGCASRPDPAAAALLDPLPLHSPPLVPGFDCPQSLYHHH